MSAISSLPSSPLFSGSRAAEANLSYEKSVRLSLLRAKAIVVSYAFNVEDIENTTAPFWEMHVDPIMLIDGGAATFATIQVNLAAGTLSMYLKTQPYLRQQIQQILRFDVLAHYCLTEVGHGLDVINLETVAVALPGGGFDLHTPTDSAAKMMPPTSPSGIPSLAVVFARLLCEGVDCGIRPFVVRISDGQNTMPGVKTKLLPPRGASTPVNHSLTYFNHVFLEESTLLGQKGPLSGGADVYRLNFLHVIWRAATGALALGSMGIPALKRAAYIAGRYSQHRKVGPRDGATSIISFRTQYTPILVALAQAAVLTEFWKVVTRRFSDTTLDSRIRHAYAAIGKAIFIHHAQCANMDLSERLGARGLLQVNDLVLQHGTLRGIAIAEGDLLGLSIRLTSELLLGRYTLPTSSNPSNLLARHEVGLLSECKKIMERTDHHRGNLVNRFILPRCEAVVRAIGHRMAYDAAVSARLDSRIIALYETAAVKLDSAWYILGAGYPLSAQLADEDKALEDALPCLEQWLADTEVERYAQVPILSPAHWKAFVDGLPEFGSAQSSEDTVEARL
ncbi:Acyl-CoA dehydrogenase NM domain-like protein [Mycena venus]|uniref:Acyl-CoA dehydrogenase NM domain-like protein n=1 Tax=Mycena venus TaxID=2733690 RepID=A0A8H6X8U9_9AGAR|nr:Acyl-CoA dehydrogenase NM domain-like protein [Mycena venus]